MEEVNKKRRDLSNEEKLKILEKFKKLPNMSQRNAATQLGISQPLLCKLLKNRTAIETSARSNENLKRKRERSGKDKQVESALKIWFGNVRQKNASVNGPILRQKAEEIAKTMGKDGFSATDGWFNRWKRRENIVYRSLHGEEKSADSIGAAAWIQTEWPKIIAEYSPQDIYNADETGLYYRAMPSQTYEFKNKRTKGCKTAKERLTVLCCVNMEGDKEKLLVIGKNLKPRCFKTVKSLPVPYDANGSAWMTSALFNSWLLKWDKKLKRKIVLLVDNCTAHKITVALKNINVVFLPANTTSLIQPCDQGIIRTFKAHYRTKMRSQIIAELDKNEAESDANKIAKKITVLDAMHLLVKAWSEVTPETIQNCFRKGGFSKFSDQVYEAEFTAPELSDSEFEDWVDMDQDLQTSAAVTIEDICQEVVGEQSTEDEPDSSDQDEEVPEEPPTNAQMQAAWDILRRGVQYRGTNFDKLYEFENYIQNLINNNKCQTTLDQFFK